jgi:hypothetical protein
MHKAPIFKIFKIFNKNYNFFNFNIIIRIFIYRAIILIKKYTNLAYFFKVGPATGQRRQQQASDISNEPATPATDPNSSNGKKVY